MRQAGFLSGRVVGGPNLRWDAAVHVRSLDGSFVLDGGLDEGTFRVGPLPTGEYLVSAGEAEVTTEVVRAAAGASDLELAVVLSPVRLVPAARRGRTSLVRDEPDRPRDRHGSSSAHLVEGGRVVDTATVQVAPGERPRILLEPR